MACSRLRMLSRLVSSPHDPTTVMSLIPGSCFDGTTSCWRPEANSHLDSTGIAKGR